MSDTASFERRSPLTSNGVSRRQWDRLAPAEAAASTVRSGRVALRTLHRSLAVSGFRAMFRSPAAEAEQASHGIVAGNTYASSAVKV